MYQSKCIYFYDPGMDYELNLDELQGAASRRFLVQTNIIMAAVCARWVEWHSEQHRMHRIADSAQQQLICVMLTTIRIGVFNARMDAAQEPKFHLQARCSWRWEAPMRWSRQPNPHEPRHLSHGSKSCQPPANLFRWFHCVFDSLIWCTRLKTGSFLAKERKNQCCMTTMLYTTCRTSSCKLSYITRMLPA